MDVEAYELRIKAFRFKFDSGDLIDDLKYKVTTIMNYYSKLTKNK